MQQPMFEIDLVPSQRAEFPTAQSMPVRNQNHHRDDRTDHDRARSP
jgi:hypothetical protein